MDAVEAVFILTSNAINYAGCACHRPHVRKALDSELFLHFAPIIKPYITYLINKSHKYNTNWVVALHIGVWVRLRNRQSVQNFPRNLQIDLYVCEGWPE
jgi:hypothetical protein